MSRAPSAGFSDFFPSAPRNAKIKARERERAKSKPLDSSATEASKSSRDASYTSKSRDEAGRANMLRSADNIELIRDASMTGTDENDLQGDLLNCVRSASSHTSTASSVFSATAPSSRAAAIPHQSALTPMTNDDLSPNGQIASPRHTKLAARNASLLDNKESISSSPAHVPPPQQESPENSIISDKWDGVRIDMRSRAQPIKAQTFVADPTNEKSRKRQRGHMKDITWVRSINITCSGSVIIGVH